MKLSAFKEKIEAVAELNFQLPGGVSIPNHFHVTEIGYITKNFIDCGGTVREEKVINFQLWYAEDKDHRLKPQKLLDIINVFEEKMGVGDFEIEVEYQSETIGKYDLGFNENTFLLAAKQTNCLAPDKCDIPPTKKKINLSHLIVTNNNCTPGSGCC